MHRSDFQKMNRTEVPPLFFMRAALEQAKMALEEGEVPVGALIVKNEKIIASGRNRREKSHRSTSHAEILAIEEANGHLGSWRLSNCHMYVTLEPCPMCAGAILQSRLDKLFFATKDPKAGAIVSLFTLLSDPRLNHQVDVEEGLLANECSAILRKFFKEIRRHKKYKDEFSSLQ